MQAIGITGGIGSGKSIVCELFRLLGVPIYQADTRGKMLMNEDETLKSKIMAYFGKDVYKTGVLDNKRLAEIVFNNGDALKKLNSFVHPAVFNDFNRWIELHKEAAYILKEAAILYESGAHLQLDATILVYAPMETRIQRVMDRDSVSRDKVLARMQFQMPDEEKQNLCNYIIYNDDSHSLIRQVLELHNSFVMAKA